MAADLAAGAVIGRSAINHFLMANAGRSEEILASIPTTAMLSRSNTISTVLGHVLPLSSLRLPHASIGLTDHQQLLAILPPP